MPTRYWDVYPRLIRMTKAHDPKKLKPVPICIVGQPSGAPVFEVSNSEIATVDGDGNVQPGAHTGSAIILVYDSPAKKSVRHVQVEVFAAATSSP